MRCYKLKRFFIVVLLSFISTSVFAQTVETQDDIFSLIKSASDLKVKNITLELKFRQPIDHNNPAAGSFEQRVILAQRKYEVETILSIL